MLESAERRLCRVPACDDVDDDGERRLCREPAGEDVDDDGERRRLRESRRRRASSPRWEPPLVVNTTAACVRLTRMLIFGLQCGETGDSPPHQVAHAGQPRPPQRRPPRRLPPVSPHWKPQITILVMNDDGERRLCREPADRPDNRHASARPQPASSEGGEGWKPFPKPFQGAKGGAICGSQAIARDGRERGGG